MEAPATESKKSAESMPSVATQGATAASEGVGIAMFVSANGDLVAKSGVEQDSWFFICHLTSGNDVIDVLVHYILVVPPGTAGFVQAIVSVLDPATNTYIAQELDYSVDKASFSRSSLNVRTPVGTVTGSAEAMHVTGNFSRVEVDLTLKQQGPLLANLGTGVFPFYSNINYEYALPTMASTGSVTIDGKHYEVTGTTWFDRQWGIQGPQFWTGQRKWSWFGISLDNGDRISLWDILDGSNEKAYATILHPNGHHEIVAIEPAAVGATENWTSPATGQTYPTRWMLKIPSLKAHLEVVPRIREQEVISPPDGPSPAHKYEAASTVSGEILGKPVTGYCVVELVGNWV